MSKNVLVFKSLFEAENMTGDLASDGTQIQWLDNIAIQANWDGDPTGTMVVQGRIGLQKGADGTGTMTPGKPEMEWETFASSVAVSGSGTVLYDLNQLSFSEVRLLFTSTFISSGVITTVADVDASLNSTYFLLDGADGDNWYIWFDVDSGGVDPMIPGRTGVEVDISEDDSADDVASALETALGAVSSIENVNAAADEVSFDQTEPGVSSMEDGEEPTGFDLEVTGSTGSLTARISGKAV